MFEGAVAALLNRYLGKYVENLDSENLNIGIFRGNVVLNNLRLKPEALYELGLPILVKIGSVSKININIPWNRLCNQTSVITIEELFILAIPITAEKFDHDIEKRLRRAEKKKILDDSDCAECSESFAATLLISVFSNLKIYIKKIHIRYEDTFTDNNVPIAIGICIYGFSTENTNSKWKPISHNSQGGSTYQLVKIDSLSLYLNPNCVEILSEKDGDGQSPPVTTTSIKEWGWKHFMRQSLETFSVNAEALDFIIKPLSAKLKIIVNKSSKEQPRITKVLTDFVLQDASLQLSHKQYLALVQLAKSFDRISINRLYRPFRPIVPVTKNSQTWWKYAYNAIVNDKIRPYTWPRMLAHRKLMHAYGDLYKKMLTEPADMKVKIDLQQLEDNLDIYSITIVRERIKMQLHDEWPTGRVVLKEQSNEPHFFASKMYKLCVDERDSTFCNRLSRNEKDVLYRMVGLAENNNEFPTASDNNNPKTHYIEHKFDFTIVHFTCSLISGNSEIVVGTMSHTVVNVETRPATDSYKLSIQIGSMLIEGASVEFCLKPLITFVNGMQGERDANGILNVNFEKKITNRKVNYVLSVMSDSCEMVYNEFSVSLLASYLHTPAMTVENKVIFLLKKFKNNIEELAIGSLRRKIILHSYLDIKFPRLVIPESGSFHYNKHVVFFDLGRLKVWSDLQQSCSNLENATQLELEERLYDRYHLTLTDLQIFMLNYDQNWRNVINTCPSRHRILSKVNLHIVFSNNIRPTNTPFPRCKLNTTIQKLKVNVSDDRMISIISFVRNLPRPRSLTIFDDSYTSSFLYRNTDNLDCLKDIRHAFAYATIKKNLKTNCDGTKEMETPFLSAGSPLQQPLPSKISEGDSEIWTKRLPGFSDNVSQHNSIVCPFRVHVLQIVLELKRSVPSMADKSYITLEGSSFSVDIAFMEYGLAAQIILGAFNIVDKLHTTTGATSPLSPVTQLLRTEERSNFLTILYRQVRPDCPDFQYFFHNMERSLVIEINPFQIVCHREALIDLYRYTRYFLDRFRSHWTIRIKCTVRQCIQRLYDKWLKCNHLPPIPPGAVKLNYSARMASAKLYLCDTDVDFILIQIEGFEFDFILKANEKFVFKVYLATIHIDDISNSSLYPKILSTQEEKLLEIKYDRLTTNFRKFGETIETHSQQTIKSDGNLKLHLGRTNLVLTFKHVYDIRRFFGPFFSAAKLRRCIDFIAQYIQKFFTYLHFSEDKICFAIRCHLPTFLLPQQASSPDLIIFNAGNLTAENFFKELIIEETDTASCAAIDNVLIKLDDILVSTAIANLNGSMMVQDTIVERVCCKIDIKRKLTNKGIPKKDDPLATFRININVNKITAVIRQTDLRALNVIWLENLKKIIHRCQFRNRRSPFSEEANVRKLQKFFNQTENNGKYLILTGTLDGLEVDLSNDVDGLFSFSPLRHENRSLCKLKVGEVTFHGVTFENGRCENQISIQSLLLEDTRAINDVFVKEILQTRVGTTALKDENSESKTIAPFVSIIWCKSQSNERKFCVKIESVRLNFIVSFLADLSQFILGPFAAYYENTLNFTSLNTDHDDDHSSNYTQIHEATNITDGLELNKNHETPVYLDSNRGEFWSFECRNPEIMFFSQMKDACKGHTVLLRFGLSFDYVQGSDIRFTGDIFNLHLTSRMESDFVRTHSYKILQPCHLHLSYTLSNMDRERKIFLSCDKIDARLSSSTVQAAVNVTREVKMKFRTETIVNSSVRKYCENSDKRFNGLWLPKKAVPHFFQDRFANFAQSGVKISPTHYETECAAISFPRITFVFEIEDVIQKKPVIFTQMAAHIHLLNWSSSVTVEGDLHLKCFYYNFEINKWEPIIEPTIKEGNVYRPWSVSVKVFKTKSHPMNTTVKTNKNDAKMMKKKKQLTENEEKLEKIIADDDELRSTSKRPHSTSTEEIDLDYSDTESESENGDTVIAKLKSKFGLLLTGTSSDEKSTSGSETTLSEDVSSLNDDDYPSTIDENDSNTSDFQENETIFYNEQENLNATILPSDENNEAAMTTTYVIIIEARDRFEMVVTPCTVSVIKQILDSFTLKFNNVLADTQVLSLKNDLIPHSTVQLLSKMPSGINKVLISTRYSFEESIPSSCNSITGTPDHLESPTEYNLGVDDNYKNIVTRTRTAVEVNTTTGNAEKPTLPAAPTLSNVRGQTRQFPSESMDDIFPDIFNRWLHITVEGFDDSTVFCPGRTCCEHYTLQPVKNNIRHYIVVSVKNDLWGQSIVVRSPLQIKNETTYAVALYYKKCSLTNCGFEHMGEITNPFEDSYKFAIVEPDDIYNIPISITYHCSIYVLPIYENYHLSENGIWWKELIGDKSKSRNIICRAKEGKPAVFVIRALITDGASFTSPPLPDMPNFTVRLFPSLIIRNLLPYAIQIKIPSADINVRIEAGGKSSVYSLDTATKSTIFIEIFSYFGSTWTGNLNFNGEMEEKLIRMKSDQDTGDSSKTRLSLSIRFDKSEPRSIVIFAPYWIINKTDLPLQIKGLQQDTIYDIFVEEPQFLRFRKSKKKFIRLRIHHSTWSSAFSIEAAGYNQLVICRDRERNRDYRILVEITLSQLNAITKLITFLPYFLLVNELNLPIRYMEENEQADLWIDLPQNQTIPFWPETNSMKMYVKYKDNFQASKHFYINQTCCNVLRMDINSAIVVEISGGQRKPFLILFRSYREGDAPVKIENFCKNLFLKISQGNIGQTTLVSPGQSLLYTWDDPTAEKKLVWNIYNRKNEGFFANIETDGYGREYISFKLTKSNVSSNKNTFSKENKISNFRKIAKTYYGFESSDSDENYAEKENNKYRTTTTTNRGKLVLFWISFLEENQRILLFTEDEQIARHFQLKTDCEKCNAELFVSIKGIGLSVVKSHKNIFQELAYISVNDSACIWEVNIAHKWKILPLELATWIEDQWKQGSRRAQLKDYVIVNLEEMRLMKPFFGELRRNYSPAVWLHCRQSPRHRYFHWQIHKFQIDNQAARCEFPTVLHSKISSDNASRSKYVLKPCVEMTALQKRRENYADILTLKYITISTAEFCLQLEPQFIEDVYELIGPCLRTQSSSLRTRADICKIYRPLTVKSNGDRMEAKKILIEHLLVSALRVQISTTRSNVRKFNFETEEQPHLPYLLYAILNYIRAEDNKFEKLKLKSGALKRTAVKDGIREILDYIYHCYLQRLLQIIYANILGMGMDGATDSNFDIDNYERGEKFFWGDESSTPIEKGNGGDGLAAVDAIASLVKHYLGHIRCSSTPSMNADDSLSSLREIREFVDANFSHQQINEKEEQNESTTPERENTDYSPAEPDSVIKGDKCFAIGVLHGLSEIRLNSVSATRENGIELYFKTAGKHLFRLLHKYNDIVSNICDTTIDGVWRAIETGTNITVRTRPPRNIRYLLGMKSYSTHHAIGMDILKNVDEGIYSDTDDYCNHAALTLDGKSCLLLSWQRIMLIEKTNLWDKWQTKWQTKVNDLVDVPQILHQQLVFKINRNHNSQQHTDHEEQSIEHYDINTLNWIREIIKVIIVAQNNSNK